MRGHPPPRTHPNPLDVRGGTPLPVRGDSMFDQYKIVTNPVAHSVALSAIFAALPLLALFILLGVMRMKAWLAGLISLGVALLVAIIVYSMPVGQAILSGTEGAAYGFFPILWIVINAIWVYNLTVVTGHFDVLRR